MSTIEDTALDVEAWLDENWDPDLTVAEWWARMAEARLAHPMLPAPWGRDWSRNQAAELAQAMVQRKALGPPSGLGMMLAAPTIIAHASEELQHRLVPRILDGQHGWCQLFSEPGAGSDLAGLQCRAERDGDEWVVTGQKVWTSLGQWADYGILIARTDPDAPKHRGITYFAFPMLQDGVEVRPLREMTGRALFNEVFLDEARVPHANVIGDVGDGWRVANTTLMVERSGIGGNNVAAPSAAIPGTIAGHLDRPAGSFENEVPALAEGGVGAGRVKSFIKLARETGKLEDPTIRQDLMRLQTMVEITGWHLGRMKSGNAATGGEGNLAKLRNSDVVRLARDLGCRILGPGATLMGPDAPSGGSIQEMTMFSPSPSIYGGSDQVQRNIIGERVLGLPKEPGPAKDTPFRELPQNTSPSR
ncbi:acyl-CoA dehydrogenase family protein [Actinomarinicola tropica]|uniref:Acyl-CoA dehydrogenase n=1 Tax=Actinomarinicola tropica TaxID=2789776 RepID=A0A5Q2RJ27_9ACTN|nr:acyl-CoA dehydrogenase family protein [Actinomarinicola tropica]QGG94017.1 acyl-CoA dehydrogenase [Actinomarinicola tropica]